MLNFRESICFSTVFAIVLTNCGQSSVNVENQEEELSDSALEALDDPGDDMTLENDGAPSWSVTNSLSIARASHVSVRLKSGKVLVIGGLRITDPMASVPPPNEVVKRAEVYDPRSGRWSSAGEPAVLRGDSHAAVRLRSGEVLVVGGSGSHGEIDESSAKAEIYDPHRGTWSLVGPMTEPRLAMSATLLPSGKVLIAGGYFQKGDEFRRLKTAELYDPKTQRFSKTGDLMVARDITVATRLFDGRVLVAGAGDPETTDGSSAEIYNPDTGVWSSTAPLHVARNYHHAVLLRSGKVLVMGGFSKLAAELSTEVFDPKKASWSIQGPLLSGRGLFGAARLRSGKVLIGGDAFQTNKISTEIFDPNSGTWAEAAQMKTSRGDHTFVLLPQGKVLAAGGATYFFAANGEERADTTANAELYTP